MSEQIEDMIEQEARRVFCTVGPRMIRLRGIAWEALSDTTKQAFRDAEEPLVRERESQANRACLAEKAIADAAALVPCAPADILAGIAGLHARAARDAAEAASALARERADRLEAEAALVALRKEVYRLRHRSTWPRIVGSVREVLGMRRKEQAPGTGPARAKT